MERGKFFKQAEKSLESQALAANSKDYPPLGVSPREIHPILGEQVDVRRPQAR